MLYASIFCLLLHRSVLTTPETFWNLYEPLLSTAAASVEVMAGVCVCVHLYMFLKHTYIAIQMYIHCMCIRVLVF